jgi:hypothetical protein
VLGELVISTQAVQVQQEQEHLLAVAVVVQDLLVLAQTQVQTMAVMAVQAEVVEAVLPH